MSNFIKLVKKAPPFKAIEFSSYEFGTVIACFALNLQEILKHESKFARFRIDLEMAKVVRVKKNV